MDIDQPTDSALDAREARLLQSLNEKLAAIRYDSCDCCWEEGFDLHVVDGECSSCRRDKGDLVKKWSAANYTHPCKSQYEVLGGAHSTCSIFQCRSPRCSALPEGVDRHGGYANC